MSPMERTAWLFTRGRESVRLEVRATPAGVQLIVDGPGAASSTHDFPGGTLVEAFREEYERTLLADGFKLQAVAERRGDAEDPPRGSDRRRLDRT
jgi:hypothetical protein